MTILKVAEKHGGRAYSTGLYLTGRHERFWEKNVSAN